MAKSNCTPFSWEFDTLKPLAHFFLNNHNECWSPRYINKTQFRFFLKEKTSSKMPLSVQRRWEIIFLSLHAKGPQLNPGAVSKLVHCSRGTVYHWLQIYKDSGDVQNISKSGRLHISSENENKKIINSVTDNVAHFWWIQHNFLSIHGQFRYTNLFPIDQKRHS